MNKWPLQSDCDDYYDDPRGEDGKADPDWEKENLVQFVPPWKMIDEDTKEPVPFFLFHKKAVQSLTKIFDTIWLMYNKDQAAIEKDNLHLFSGSYVFRPIRGGTHLSMHAYGVALDIAAGLNEMGKPYDPKHGLPMKVVHVFEKEKAIWGGRWHGRPDAMHFQFAIVG